MATASKQGGVGGGASDGGESRISTGNRRCVVDIGEQGQRHRLHPRARCWLLVSDAVTPSKSADISRSTTTAAEAFLTAEVLVDHRLGDIGALGDLLDGGSLYPRSANSDRAMSIN